MLTLVRRTLPALLFLACALPLLAQANLLQSGPMVGYADMREVALWVQTNAAANVQFVYWDSAAPGQKYTTSETKTTSDKAFAATLIADKVQPGKVYFYEVHINGKKVTRPYPLRFQTLKLWQFREDPPTFRLALGSCAYINEERYDRPGRSYGGDYQIFTSIYQQHPDVMLWLGDNMYLREPDWNTWTGILHRYTHTRSLPEIQPLLGSVSNYAIWDDHDFGPNDADRGFWNKDKTLAAFKLFWANPGYGVNGMPGTATRFEWADAEFFLLDNRYYRSPNTRKTTERTVLGKEQLQWLIDALASSRATFKIIAIGGQALNPAAVYENYSTYPEERAQLLELIRTENIPGVIFVDGDRHITELSKLEREGTYPLYDLTVSPLTSGPGRNAAGEGNTMVVPGTIVEERNFGVMEFSGPREDRKLKITVYNSDGVEKWNRTIQAKELK